MQFCPGLLESEVNFAGKSLLSKLCQRPEKDDFTLPPEASHLPAFFHFNFANFRNNCSHLGAWTSTHHHPILLLVVFCRLQDNLDTITMLQIHTRHYNTCFSAICSFCTELVSFTAMEESVLSNCKVLKTTFHRPPKIKLCEFE